MIEYIIGSLVVIGIIVAIIFLTKNNKSNNRDVIKNALDTVGIQQDDGFTNVLDEKLKDSDKYIDDVIKACYFYLSDDLQLKIKEIMTEKINIIKDLETNIEEISEIDFTNSASTTSIRNLLLTINENIEKLLLPDVIMYLPASTDIDNDLHRQLAYIGYYAFVNIQVYYGNKIAEATASLSTEEPELTELPKYIDDGKNIYLVSDDGVKSKIGDIVNQHNEIIIKPLIKKEFTAENILTTDDTSEFIDLEAIFSVDGITTSSIATTAAVIIIIITSSSN